MHVHYVMRKRLENLNVYKEEVGRLSFDMKEREREREAVVLILEEASKMHCLLVWPAFHIRGGFCLFVCFLMWKKDRLWKRLEGRG